MLKKLNNNRGASMLLAICIFMFLAVLGFNVLAAVQANVSNTAEEVKHEQGIQMANSYFEVVDSLVRNGDFIVDGYLAVADTKKDWITEGSLISKQPFMETEHVNRMKIYDYQGKEHPYFYWVEFYYYRNSVDKTEFVKNGMKVKYCVKEAKDEDEIKTYSVSAYYDIDATNPSDSIVKYKCVNIEGVTYE